MVDIKYSVIIPSKNEGSRLMSTVDSVEGTFDGNDKSELIVVDDGSTDGSGQAVEDQYGDGTSVRVITTDGLGVGQARNLGATLAKGQYLIFLDAHCDVPFDWLAELTQPLATTPHIGITEPAFGTMDADSVDIGTVGVGMTFKDASLDQMWVETFDTHRKPVTLDWEPQPALIAMGACLAVRRADWFSLGAFDDTLYKWGSEQAELSLRWSRKGRATYTVPRVQVLHYFRDTFPYDIDSVGIALNRIKIALLHFGEDRLQRVIDHYTANGVIGKILQQLLASDIMDRRASLQERFPRTADALIESFGCEL